MDRTKTAGRPVKEGDVRSSSCPRVSVSDTLLICPALPEFRKYDPQHGDEAGQAADHVGNGLCREDAVCAKMEHVREQVGQRDNNDGLAEEGEEDGVVLFAQGFEGRLSAVLQHHKNESAELREKYGLKMKVEK